MGPFVSGWVSERVRACVRLSVALYLVGTIQTTVFARSLSSFTCTLLVIRGGTLLILGHGVKGQGQIWHSVYKTVWAQYILPLYSDHFQTSHVSCRWWEEEPYWFVVTGSKVKVKFGILCIKPCGHNCALPCRHDTDNSSCLITFKLHMEVVDNERRNPIDCGSRGQRSRSTLALCE